MPKFRKKPVVIEAMQFQGATNGPEVSLWSGGTLKVRPEFALTEYNPARYSLQIETLEGVMTAFPGDWIIQGVNGEFYPCKDEIFKKTYEPVE